LEIGILTGPHHRTEAGEILGGSWSSIFSRQLFFEFSFQMLTFVTQVERKSEPFRAMASFLPLNQAWFRTFYTLPTINTSASSGES